MFKTIPRTSLRGGGCISSPPNRVQNVTNNSTGTTADLPPDFQKSINDLSRRIKESTLTSIDDKGTLMNCFQYFFLNERVFNVLVENQKLASSNVDLLQQIVTDLMESAKIFIKSNPIYCYYCVQISAWIWRVLFWFCTRNDKRYLSVDQHQEYTNQACGIEKELEIEGGGDIYGNSIRYELFVIKTILTIYPTNSAEGQEILQLFAQGAIASLISMTVSDDLAEAVWRGAQYAVKQGVKMYLKQKYYQIHGIETLKWQVIDSIVTSSQSTRSLINKMMQMYKEIKSTSWETQQCWIKSIGSIISLKPQLDRSELDLDLQTMQQLISQHSIISITPKIIQINLDANKINQFKEAKQLYDSVPCLSKLAEMQEYLLKGHQSFPKFEQYNVDFSEINNKVSLSQYFIHQFDNLHIDYYIKKIQASHELLNKTSQLLKFELNNELNEIEKSLEFFSKEKEQINQLIDKLMDINIYYITLNYIADQWNQYNRPNVDLKQIETEIFQQHIILHQLEMIVSIDEQQQKYKEQTNENIIDYSPLLNIKKELINNYEKLINQDQTLNQNNISHDFKQQMSNLNKKLFVFTLGGQRILTAPNLEYAIQQRLLQCSLAFQLHQWNIRTLIQIQSNLAIIIKVLEDCQETKFTAEIKERIALKQLQLLVLQVVPVSGNMSVDLLELIKQINPKQLDKITTGYTFPSDEIMNTYKIQQYEANNVTLPLRAMLSIFASCYQTNIVSNKVRSIDYRIFQLQQILSDIIKYQTYYNKRTQRFVQFMKSIALVDSQSNQEQVEFWQKFKKFIEETAKNPSITDISNFQLQLTNRQKQLQLSYQSMISFNPYNIQATQQYEQENTALNSIVKLINLIIEIDKSQPQNSKLYINNLLKQINQLSDVQLLEADKIYKAQKSEKQQVDKKQEQIIIKYEQKLDQFLTLSKTIENNLNYMKSQIVIIQEVLQACRNVGSIDDWLQQVETYQSEQFIEFCKFQLPDCLVDCNDQFQADQQIQSELMQTIQPTLQNNQSVYDQIRETIQSDKWKIRECMAMQLIRLSGNCIRLEVKQYAEMIILRMKIYETHKKVRALLNSPQNATLINQVLQQHWPSQQESIVQEIKGGMIQLNSLLYELQKEQDVEKRKQLQYEYQEQENEIQEQLSNVQEVGNALGITMLFIQDLKKDLAKIDQKITEIQQNLTSMNNDLQFLRGKTVYQLLEIRKGNILKNKQQLDATNIYIEIECLDKKFNKGSNQDSSNQEGKVNPEQLETQSNKTYLYFTDDDKQGEINNFINSDKLQTLFIHGPAGSGKSTASRKIEEYFWEEYGKPPLDCQIVPIFIPLPFLQDPVYSAIHETLKSDAYKFNANQIRELKDLIEKRNLSQ